MKDNSSEAGSVQDPEARELSEEEILASKQRAEAARQKREEREAKLRQMMDDDDGDADVDMNEPSEEDVDAGAGVEVAEGVNLDVLKPGSQASNERIVDTSDGRRRGRRRVTKKRTTKDAEGYLVTKEEQVWESFSEDEPEPKRKIAVPPPAVKSEVAVKDTKGDGKKGQGNIMNFFGKKG